MSDSRVAAIQGLLLALWIGAAFFFTTVVARAAFAVLPSRSLAGALVGRVLPVLLIAGILTGIAVAVLEWPAARGRWGRFAAGVVMVTACGITQFAVAPRIERLRAAVGVPLEALVAGDPRRAAFGRLHAVSVGWLGVAMLAAVVALFLNWRALEASRPSPRPVPPIVPTDG